MKPKNGEKRFPTGEIIRIKGNYRTEASSTPDTKEKRTLFLSLWAVLSLLATRLFPRSSVSTSLLSLTSIASLFLFFKLMDEVQEQGHGTTLFDQTVLTYFHQHGTAPMDTLARLCAVMGSLEVLGLVTILGVILGIRIHNLRPAVHLMPIAALGSLAILNIIKFSIQRTRPTLFPALFGATGYSFPSGHAFLSIVLYGLLGYFLLQIPGVRGIFRWVISLFTLVFVLTIGISRAYAVVHFPTDVLGGWAAGFPCLYLMILWSKWLTEKSVSPIQQET